MCSREWRWSARWWMRTWRCGCVDECTCERRVRSASEQVCGLRTCCSQTPHGRASQQRRQEAKRRHAAGTATGEERSATGRPGGGVCSANGDQAPTTTVGGGMRVDTAWTTVHCARQSAVSGGAARREGSRQQQRKREQASTSVRVNPWLASNRRLVPPCLVGRQETKIDWPTNPTDRANPLPSRPQRAGGHGWDSVCTAASVS